jgi:hypothetical protein
MLSFEAEVEVRAWSPSLPPLVPTMWPLTTRWMSPRSPVKSAPVSRPLYKATTVNETGIEETIHPSPLSPPIGMRRSLDATGAVETEQGAIYHVGERKSPFGQRICHSAPIGKLHKYFPSPRDRDCQPPHHLKVPYCGDHTDEGRDH